jgi:hypothetical protein
MPGTGPLRRSSVLARKKAIVGKSLVAAERLQRPSIAFVCSAGLGGASHAFSYNVLHCPSPA